MEAEGKPHLAKFATRRGPASPRQRLPWPPISYQEWLAGRDSDHSPSKLQKKATDEVEQGPEWPYHSHDLDALFPTTELPDASRCLLGTLDDLKNDLKAYACEMNLQMANTH